MSVTIVKRKREIMTHDERRKTESKDIEKIVWDVDIEVFRTEVWFVEENITTIEDTSMIGKDCCESRRDWWWKELREGED